jgi:hypothetical protein
MVAQDAQDSDRAKHVERLIPARHDQDGAAHADFAFAGGIVGTLRGCIGKSPSECRTIVAKEGHYCAMHIRYSLTLDDYKEYQRMYFDSLAGFWVRNHLPIFVSFGLLVSIAGLNWNLNRHTPRFYGFLCVALGLCLVWRGLWFRYRKWSRWFSRNVHKFHDLEGDITAEGLTWRGKTDELQVRWAHYSAFAETERLFVLIDQQHSCVIIPKRAFPPDALHAFRNWVPQELKNR